MKRPHSASVYDRYESRLLWLFGVWLLALVRLPTPERVRGLWPGLRAKITAVPRSSQRAPPNK